MEQKAKLHGASFSILGDSYSTFAGNIPEKNDCYYPNAANVRDVLRVEDTWWHLLMTRNGMKLVLNDSYSGATVCTEVRETQPLSAAFTERAKNNFTGKESPDYIFFFGSTNDSWLERTIGQLQFGNWSEDDLKRVLPACCYVLDVLTKANPNSVVVTVINTDLHPEIAAGMAEAAAHYGAVPVILRDIDKENGHPSALGMTQIADQVEAAVKQ